MRPSLVAFGAAQGLLDFNPASHGVWLVALAIVGVFAVIVLVDLVGRLLEWAANRRAGVDRAEEGPGEVRVTPPDSELRRRHHSEPPKVGRDRAPNDPDSLAR